jgi:hypothetical protein
MTTDETAADGREQGLEIGSLADRLDAHSYPASTAELVDEYGDHEIDLPDGTKSFGEILSGVDETYESAEAVRQMLYTMVGSDAVGREGYSDRGGVAADENGTADESF